MAGENNTVELKEKDWRQIPVDSNEVVQEQRDIWGNDVELQTYLYLKKIVDKHWKKKGIESRVPRTGEVRLLTHNA